MKRSTKTLTQIFLAPGIILVLSLLGLVLALLIEGRGDIAAALASGAPLAAVIWALWRKSHVKDPKSSMRRKHNNMQ